MNTPTTCALCGQRLPDVLTRHTLEDCQRFQRGKIDQDRMDRIARGDFPEETDE